MAAVNAAARPAAVTVALCFAAALLEGLDIQAAGVAAPKLVPAFGLTPAQAGRLFSASVVGLLLGAAYGGRLADRVGRKRVLVGSLVVFGACSLATALAWTPGLLVAGRFLTGVGLGGAMPNLIALSAEAGPPRLRTTLVTVMFSGVPLGGAVASAIGAWGGGALDWRAVFYVGGVGPLLVAPLLAAALPESAPFRAAQAGADGRGARAGGQPGVSAWDALFGGPRAATTLLLWPCFFCTLLVLYLLMNWLPLLLVGKGFGRADALRVSVLFNVGGALGAVALGLLMDRAGRGARRLVMLATYAGAAASLVALARVGADLGQALGAGFAAGLFVIGAQLVLYGMAPGYYETRIRGTGVGAAVAAGRAGSVAGPLVAGQLLGAGASAAAVLTAILPAVAVAGAAALLLVTRPAAPDRLDDVTPRPPPAPPRPASGHAAA